MANDMPVRRRNIVVIGGSAGAFRAVTDRPDRRPAGLRVALSLGPHMSCPDRGGTLPEIDDAKSRVRCRVGHGCTADALSEVQTGKPDVARRTAPRGMRARAGHPGKLENATRNGEARPQCQFSRPAAEPEQPADTLMQFILSRENAGEVEGCRHDTQDTDR